MVMFEKRSVMIRPALLLFGLTFLSAFFLALPSAHAEDSVVTTTAITISESCSMTGTVNTPHNASVINGTYSGASYPNGIGQTTLKAFCNDNAGFAIYAIGFTDDEYGNTKLHSSTLGSTYDINTGTYNSGSASSSTWSMKLTSVSGTYAPTISDGTNNTENFTTWHVVPQEYTKVAYRTAGTDTDNSGTGIGSSLTTTYDAYISNTQPAGTYIGQVKYTLVHPNKVDNSNKPVAPLKDSDCLAGYVCYAPNASDIEGSMSSLGTITSSPKAGRISVGTSATTINLIAPNYKRAGFGFAGWSTDFEANNSSTIYGPNETLTVPSTTLAEKGMILYPVWIAARTNTTMQTWTTNDCNSLADIPTSGRATLASMTALTDTRDDNVYTVAKLVDGKCWMTENLRLNTEDSTNSNLAQGFGGAFTGLPSTTDSWNTSNYTRAQFNNNNTNLGGKNASGTDLSISHNTSNDHVQWYSYGNYYSWPAAIADTTAYNSTNGHTTVETSICPTGWHLPYGNNGNSSPNLGNTAGGFYYLGVQIGATESSAASSVKWRTFPNNFIYSGYWGGSSASNRGSLGYYWSSSASSSSGAYSLGFRSSSVSPGTGNGNKYNGFTVRCVAGGSGS